MRVDATSTQPVVIDNTTGNARTADTSPTQRENHEEEQVESTSSSHEGKVDTYA